VLHNAGVYLPRRPKQYDRGREYLEGLKKLVEEQRRMKRLLEAGSRANDAEDALIYLILGVISDGFEKAKVHYV
jgi:hypothetical protein